MFFANLSLSRFALNLSLSLSHSLFAFYTLSLSLSISLSPLPLGTVSLMSHSRRKAQGRRGRGVACMTAIDMWLNEHPRMSRWFVFGSILGAVRRHKGYKREGEMTGVGGYPSGRAREMPAARTPIDIMSPWALWVTIDNFSSASSSRFAANAKHQNHFGTIWKWLQRVLSSTEMN